MTDFSQKSLVVVTGASRGIGRAISVQLSKKLKNSVLVLIARSRPDLDKVKADILGLNKSLTVLVFSIDLSKPDMVNFQTIFDEVTSKIDKSIDFGMIFHNAGHVGQVKSTTDLTNLEDWRSYFDLNFFSVCLLNSIFVKRIHSFTQKLFVVNITSLCGRKPFVNLSQYGSCKAARELFFKVLAVEEDNIRVLNYSPGPVDTDMFNSIIETADNKEVKKDFQNIKETSILTPELTVEKLLEILEKGQFKSGDTIDYFDNITSSGDS